MRTSKPIFVLMLMLALLNLVPNAASAAASTAPSARDREAQLLGELGGARVARHGDTGKVRFIGASGAQPVKSAASLRAPASPESAARAFLGRYGSLFGIDDAASELRTVRVGKAGGRSSVRFQQMYKGVPVLGGELIVNTDASGNVLSANGETTPDATLDATPTVSAAAARRTALTAAGKAYELPTGALSASKPQLWVYDARLLGGPIKGGSALVWRMDVRGGNAGEIRELVLIDAKNGSVALHFNQVAEAKNRRICDAVNTQSRVPCTSPYRRVEGQAATGISDVDLAYEYGGVVYDYFKVRFNRDSIDGAGMPIVQTVRYCEGACPYENAFWNGSQMVYGPNFASADDVVGHEMAHGITERTSNLFYWYQSGAINESMSDVFGEFVDLTYNNAVDNDTAAARWLMGEDLPIGAIRSMSNPTAYGDPDRMQSPNYYKETGDNGGVHFNSGVGNKAAYLIANTGTVTFNGRTVTGLGLEKAARIFYDVNSNILTSGSDYLDLYEGLYQACLNLTGTAGITAANCTEVRDATLATQMNLQPSGGTAFPDVPEAPMCNAGQIPTDLYYDNFEHPSPAWVKQTNVGANGWTYDFGYSTSGRNMLYGADPATTTDSSIAQPVATVIPTGRTVYMRFSHAENFEYGFDFYDGGVVEYSANGGAWTQVPASWFTHNGYGGTIASGNPLAGRPAFVSLTGGYYSSRVVLPTTLAGRSIKFRFRIGTDSSNLSGNFWGWVIDDVRVYSCASGSRPGGSSTNLLRNASFEWDDNDDGYADFWSQDNSALRMPTVKRTGRYAIRHKAVDNGVYAVGQTVSGLTAGTAYTASAYVNIPTTSSAVSFTYEVQFRNSSGGVIQTRTIKTYADDTAGTWNLASLRVTAPTGTTSAKVRMVQRGLGATVYADDLVFRP